MTYDQFGTRIREARQLLGLRLLDVARKARLSESQLSRLERGEQPLHSETAARISRALGISAHELLLAGSGDPDLELERLGLAPSPMLRDAMADGGFLRFMKRCTRTARAHKMNLTRMERLFEGEWPGVFSKDR